MQTTEKHFENMIRENEGLLHKVCSMYAFTPQDREDLFQEIVIRIWKSLPGFKGLSKASTWMYRIALNAAIIRIKTDKRREPLNADALWINKEITEQNPENQLWDEVVAAVNLLNPVEKAIVMLYIEDYSYEEMEEILGIAQNTIRVKMTRIKEKLRENTKVK
jgi:RNA polymerase sigma-70 factor (ECF subfamily)